MHIIKTTASIPTKFCIVIKTIKCPSRVVQSRSSPIQDGGRPPSWKIEKSPYLSNALTDCREIWHDDAYWHVDTYFPYGQLKTQPFKNPKWRTATVITIKKSQYVGKGSTNRDDLTVTHLNPD